MIDKCFKLHDFPPDFKFTKAPTNTKRMAAQVELSKSASQTSATQPGLNSSTTASNGTNYGCNSGTAAGRSPDVCSQIMQLLKLVNSSPDSSMSSASFAGNIST